MENITVLDKLLPKEACYKTAGALFLTYSINATTILLANMQLSNLLKKKDIRIKEICRQLMDKNREDKEKIGFVCMNGCAKSTGVLIEYYASNYIYHYRTEYSEKMHNFHPKLYVIKYINENDNKDIYFRFLIGSMNFVDSPDKEVMTCFDIKAYEKEDICNHEDEYSKITWLEELLELKKNYFEKNEKEKLKKILDNLGLDEKYYFKKNEIPDVLIFPKLKDDKKKKLKEADIIYSPFLSEPILKERLSHIKEKHKGQKYFETGVYTMEEELFKCGFEEMEESVEDEQGFAFYVYQLQDNKQENENKRFHYKAYLFDEERENLSETTMYVGSLNYTSAAFNNNKEILVKLDVKEEEYNEIKKELSKNFLKKIYKRVENQEKREEINRKRDEDKLKKYMLKISRILNVRYNIEKEELIVSKIENSKKYEEEIYKDFPEKFEKDKYNIYIKPDTISEKKKISRDENEYTWNLDRSVNITQEFELRLENEKGERFISICVHLDWAEEKDKIIEEIEERKNLFREDALNKCLSMGRFQDGYLSKKYSDVCKNLDFTERTVEVRNNIPSLESMLKEALSQKKSIEQVVEDSKEKINKIRKIKERMKREYGMTKLDRKEYGYLDDKWVEQMIKQFENICTELNIRCAEESE